MLTCVYHPIDPMRVVESDEAFRMKATGFWFDSPAKAREYRDKVEQDIDNEEKYVKRTYKKKGILNER